MVHSKDTGSIATVKKMVQGKQPLIAQLPLSQLSFGKDGAIQVKTTDGKSKSLLTTKNAYWRFIKNVLDAPPGFINRFKTITNQDTQVAMLQSLLAGTVAKKGGNVNMIANPTTMEVTAFGDGSSIFRTHDQTIELLEQVMNVYGELNFSDYDVTGDGELVMRLHSNRDIAMIKGEDHLGGITITNSYEHGMRIAHSTIRQVCTNGMVARGLVDLGLTSRPDSLTRLFDKLTHLQKNNWVHPNYWQLVQRAMDVHASVAELMSVDACLRRASNIAEYGENRLEKYAPLGQAETFLLKRGVNMQQLNTIQQKNCPSHMKLWDLVNNLTDFASHDYGYEVSNRMFMQDFAGKLLYKKPDAQGFVHLS